MKKLLLVAITLIFIGACKKECCKICKQRVYEDNKWTGGYVQDPATNADQELVQCNETLLHLDSVIYLHDNGDTLATFDCN